MAEQRKTSRKRNRRNRGDHERDPGQTKPETTLLGICIEMAEEYRANNERLSAVLAEATLDPALHEFLAGQRRLTTPRTEIADRISHIARAVWKEVAELSFENDPAALLAISGAATAEDQIKRARLIAEYRELLAMNFRLVVKARQKLPSARQTRTIRLRSGS